MMKRTMAWMGLAALLPLAACNKGAEQTAGNRGANAAISDRGGAAGAAGVKLTPGEWETSTEIVDLKMEGLPAGVPQSAMDHMRPPRTTVKSCLTPEDAANPNARMLAAQADSRCTSTRADMSGGQIDIAMSCPAPQGSGAMTMTMTGQYSDTSYEMNGDMVMEGPNGVHMTMKSHTTGRRIGDCPA